ncbi:hypothetical protein FJM51_19650 [Amaricoccus solimangrovi]|uniref:Uncharacterized protein n=1 Tax=Amaricoccus solimangrovi TaxID=2589815 RepID=A0A501WKH6_9RHOB|nr:hypothetical protein FJM51_19650 [Amaricoccus solimangrovi]
MSVYQARPGRWAAIASIADTSFYVGTYDSREEAKEAEAEWRATHEQETRARIHHERYGPKDEVDHSRAIAALHLLEAPEEDVSATPKVLPRVPSLQSRNAATAASEPRRVRVLRVPRPG